MARKQFAHPRDALNAACSKGEPIVGIERRYLCVVPHYWGRGRTIEEAKAQCRRAGADGVNKRDGYIIHAFNVPAGTPDKELPWVGADSYVRWAHGTTKVYVELVRTKGGRVLEGEKDSRIDHG